MEPSKEELKAWLEAGGTHLNSHDAKRLIAGYLELQKEYEDVLVDRNKLLGELPALQQQLREKDAGIISLKISVKNLEADLAASQLEVERLKQRLDDVNVKDSVKTREINLLVDDTHRLQAENATLKDKALRFDLDQAGIERRETEAVELISLRAENAALQQENERLKRQLRYFDDVMCWGGITRMLKDGPVDEIDTEKLRAVLETRDELRTLLRELAEALKDIRSDPHGCVFCDSGKLRNPQKQHQPRCGFAKIEAALSRAEEVLK